MPAGVLPMQGMREMNAIIEDSRRRSRQRRILPFEEGVMLERKSFTASASVVLRPGLGRTPSGWLVTRITGDANYLYEVDRDAESLTLKNNGSATVVVDLWIF